MSQQQTVLRVQVDNVNIITGITEYETLDLYSDIPIKINKSFAELQDIAKRNSDLSIGLSLPGSKKNNRFFESFFNVDVTSLYFNATKRVNCDVLLNDQCYFRGYMRLNKVSVMNSKVEYDVTLYSTIGDLFGQIGNNLLKDLDFDDPVYTFNHTFIYTGVTELMYQSNFYRDQEQPWEYFYPIVHNGYNYINVSGATLPNLSGTTSGATITEQTRIYTSTSPISGYTSAGAAYAAGVQDYYINSPQNGLLDNQLKPALSIWNLIKLIFKTYGYTISGDFFNTPWMKTLYLYGYFSSEQTKFSYKLNTIQSLPSEGVELIYSGSTVPNSLLNIIVCKRGTGVPCYSLDDFTYGFANMFPYSEFGTIAAGTSGLTITAVEGFDFGFEVDGVPVADISTLRYAPKAVGSSVSFMDGDEIDFSLVIDQNIKQIDLLGSIAKKFNLVFIPNPDNPIDIQIEPYDFYVGTGEVYDWTPKLSYDKGFTVEPALNYIESNLLLTDQEDGDEGNRVFKLRNNRIYGQNNIYNPTDFKSQEKKIDTIFSPELIRKWDDYIGLPLGINYSASSEQSSYDNQIRWLYKGVKSKPKLFFWSMGLNPFIDQVGEVYQKYPINTYSIKIGNSTGGTPTNFDLIPTISHTIPMGLSDSDKINNDSFSILFNSEQPVDIGVQTYNTYTENDSYNTFYKNRIINLYDSNTRFLSGYFDLKYSEIQNLKPNDIIKINEQYFTWNKIEAFNLTNRELTKVELIQFNINPQQYVDRYFAYYYCEAPETCYKIKTDFTNENLRDTNYLWSIYYDNQVGSLTGTTTGFTSSFRYFNIVPTGDTDYVTYEPYSMYEITEDEYNNGGCIDFVNDPFLYGLIYNSPDPTNGPLYALASFWESLDHTGVNVWESCADFNDTADRYGIRLNTIPLRNGKYVMIQSLYPWVSIDGGYTFTQRTAASPQFYAGSCINLNGTRFYGALGSNYAAGKIYLSTNYGVSWSAISTSPTLNYHSVYCSSNGQHIVAVARDGGGVAGGLVLSNDYGSTWTIIDNISYYYTLQEGKGVYIDSTGSNIIAARAGNFLDASPFTYVRIGVNTGTGTTMTDLTTAPQAYWTSVCMSDGGQYIGIYGQFSQTGSTDDNRVYISNDYGATFTYMSGFTNPIDSQISISSNGKYWCINASGYFAPGPPRIWVSDDYGATFTDSAPAADLLFVTSAIAQSGKTMAVGKRNIAPSDPTNNKAYISYNSGLSFNELSGFGYGTDHVAINR
jgi:hypothetical protein